MNLDDRRELDTLHALDDLESRHELKERSILERLHILDDLKEMEEKKPRPKPRLSFSSIGVTAHLYHIHIQCPRDNHKRGQGLSSLRKTKCHDHHHCLLFLLHSINGCAG